MRQILVLAILLPLGDDGRTEAGGSGPALEFDGLIEAARVVQLSAAVDGILETVEVDRGDLVTKGQVVATLESEAEEAAVEVVRARSELEGELKKQAARREYAQARLRQDEELHRKGIVSEEALGLTRTEYLLAEASVLEAKELLQLAELERRREEATLARRTIRSPVDGVVVERFLSPGELVTRQMHSKILAIAQIQPLVVEVLLPSSHFGKILPAASAWVNVETSPAARYEAEVKVVDRVIDSASGTFRVRLEMLNADGAIPAGSKCRVQFKS